jgi:hypothetical protein
MITTIAAPAVVVTTITTMATVDPAVMMTMIIVARAVAVGAMTIAAPVVATTDTIPPA